jgi:hypothetical protein
MVAGQHPDLIAHRRAAWTSGLEESTRWVTGRDSHISTATERPLLPDTGRVCVAIAPA